MARSDQVEDVPLPRGKRAQFTPTDVERTSHNSAEQGHLCTFSQKASRAGEATTLKLAGKPCKDLLAALGKLEKFDLPEAAKKAPETGGLNIESPCAQGETLLIGFRGPVVASEALVVPLTNPRAVVEKGEAPKLGAPFTLDLGGRGVRDMAPWNGQFLIIEGDSKDSGKTSEIYLWSGVSGSRPRELKANLGTLNPEAIVVQGEGEEAIVRLLSDDGGSASRSVTIQTRQD